MEEKKEGIDGMENWKVVAPDPLPVKLLNLDDTDFLRHFYSIAISVCRTREIPEQ